METVSAAETDALNQSINLSIYMGNAKIALMEASQNHHIEERVLKNVPTVVTYNRMDHVVHALMEKT